MMATLLADPPKRSRHPKPFLTDAGRERYLERARDSCGPLQLATKVHAVGEAYKHGDWKMLSGALADLAAVSVAWEKQVRIEQRNSYV